MSNIAQDLTRLMEKIEVAKKQKASLEGQQIEILRQLKIKYGVNSFEEAQELLKEKESSVNDLEKEIKNKFDELKSNYNW